ncbi:MAG: nicotinamide mononucleotide transporter [Myxococcaceae bacterium]|nr:nicotinamide mononucleotide transporter [Myxococcaceae bacterium]
MLLDALQQPAFHLFGVEVKWAEVLGDVTGAACVWLVARQHVLNWPLGLLNNVFWAVLFFHSKLYADATLQGFFFALGVYGWVLWARRRPGDAAPKLPVRRTTRREWAALGAAAVPATAAATVVLARLTDSPVPFWDSLVLTLSLAATYGQANKLLESWWVWILVDVISVPLYLSRGLYPTAALYVVFFMLCIKGLRDWSRELT